jgi:hypothetical protein
LDPHSSSKLNPDPHSLKNLDPDPQKVNADLIQVFRNDENGSCITKADKIR